METLEFVLVGPNASVALDGSLFLEITDSKGIERGITLTPQTHEALLQALLAFDPRGSRPPRTLHVERIRLLRLSELGNPRLVFLLTAVSGFEARLTADSEQELRTAMSIPLAVPKAPH